MLVCPWRGHDWGEPYEVGFGPLGFVAGDPDSLSWTAHQCERCFAVENFIPEFASEDEAAEYWQTHTIPEFNE